MKQGHIQKPMEPKLNHVETGSEVNDKITVHITKHKPDNKIVRLLAYIYIYIYIYNS